MTRKRVSAALGVAAAMVGAAGVLAMPVASADTLSNGLTVTCSPDSETGAICIVSGCPRVNGDYVVDALHVRFASGNQYEYEYKCINGATHGEVPQGGGEVISFSVQACRKKDLEGDWCTPFSQVDYRPPAKPAAPAPAKPAPPAPPAPVQQQQPDVQCPPGSPVSSVPAGQTCPAIPAQTNAIQASFGDPGLSTLDLTVTNTSTLTAACEYVATANSVNPLVPKKTTRSFQVPANGNHTESFSGAPTLTNYKATVSCKDASGEQKVPLGNVQLSVTW